MVAKMHRIGKVPYFFTISQEDMIGYMQERACIGHGIYKRPMWKVLCCFQNLNQIS